MPQQSYLVKRKFIALMRILLTFLRVDERKVLRIGAMDYEPLEQVKRLTLDFKIEKRIQEEQLRMQEY